ncbi:hypothetical protein ACJJTC_010356 [Scirpophaga incertulas]
MNTVCEGLEDLADVRMDTTDQHVDASDSRVKRDTEDINKLLEWFLLHDPFPVVPRIMSIASGVVGDDKINCHNARAVGLASITKMTGQTFNNIKLKRADRVLPLLSASSVIKVHNEKVPMDPALLFQRMSITKTFQDELEQFFAYELAPYPLSLFDAVGMRKTMKSALYNCFDCLNFEIDNANAIYIIDGGYLLHHVVWNRDETFHVIFEKYVQYIQRHFGHNSVIVFDGYTDHTKNIKAAEQRRRTIKTSSSVDIVFDRSMKVSTNQQQFLANTYNKSRFISMLCEELTAAGIPIKQADNDADVLIIETAIEQFESSKTTVVVGEDVDLLILLTARTPTDKIIYFLKPGKAQVQSRIYSSQSLTAYPKCQAHILFLHAITGCDTTSAIFKRGKTAVFKLFEKCNDLIECAEVFKNINSSRNDIVTYGIRFLLAMYGAPKKIDSIDKYRYLSQSKPYSHLLRKNYLIQIFCNCKTDCSKNCGCQKVGLYCSPVCINCQGQTCLNIELNTIEENIYDINEETIEEQTEILQEEKSEDEEIIVEVELDSYLLQ